MMEDRAAIAPVLEQTTAHKGLQQIAQKVLSGQRINQAEALLLLEQAELGWLGLLAHQVRLIKNGKSTFFNRNLHIEPTNKCIYHCEFCSYSQTVTGDAWEYSREEMLEQVRKMPADSTEVHIVGGVHPEKDVYYYGELIKQIKALRPDVHVKAYTAVELEHMIALAKIPLPEGMQYLKDCGLDSIPGGGAEIFDEELRAKICGDKTSSTNWLHIHSLAHQCGIPTNATILYGHLESPSQRIDHLDRLRQLQDQTGGFNAFIPLKFKNANNKMHYVPEVSVVEDLKNYAISRIYLDNIPHIKAYWPMIGKQLAQISLSFGVDDLDGTINDSTKIYSLAGANDQNPSMHTDEMIQLIREAGLVPVERDSLYRVIRQFE